MNKASPDVCITGKSILVCLKSIMDYFWPINVFLLSVNQCFKRAEVSLGYYINTT